MNLKWTENKLIYALIFDWDLNTGLHDSYNTPEGVSGIFSLGIHNRKRQVEEQTQLSWTSRWLQSKVVVSHYFPTNKKSRNTYATTWVLIISGKSIKKFPYDEFEFELTETSDSFTNGTLWTLLTYYYWNLNLSN
jgi:hypothetical protein